jgi:type VI secretion system protein VasD
VTQIASGCGRFYRRCATRSLLHTSRNIQLRPLLEDLMNYMRIFGLAVLVVVAMSFSGCASGPRPTLPTDLAVAVVASARANPDVRGRPSPVVVRIYELKTPALFSAADFFSLNDKEQATLGSDLLHREEIVVSPGEIRELKRKISGDARTLAVVVAYRDLERSVWRTTRTIAAPNEAGRIFTGRGKNERVVIDVGERAVSIRSE